MAILTEIEVGKHNADLEASSTRILESGSWKDMSTVWVFPAGKTIPTKVVLSWLNMIGPPNGRLFKIATIGMEVGEAYTDAIKQILANPVLAACKYLLTVEHDNIPPSDGLVKLQKQMEAHPEFACIGGLYWTKGPDGVPQIWGDPKDPITNFRPQVPRTGQLVECCGTGMGFNLWRMDLFKDSRLRQPWFKTIADETGAATQDLYFWGDARKYGYRCAIDCSILVGHYDVEGDIVW
jgi:hypothetical protein